MSPQRPVAAPSVPERPGSHPLQATRLDGGGADDDELVDAAWLYAWSHEALHPVRESVGARVTAAG